MFGSDPGEILGIKIHLQWENNNGDIKTGFYYLLSYKVWGIHPKDALLHARLEENILRAVATFTGGGVPIMGRSIASTAMKWYTRFFDNQEVDGMHYPKMTQLPPRWRSIAASSFHGGPCIKVRGLVECRSEICL